MDAALVHDVSHRHKKYRISSLLRPLKLPLGLLQRPALSDDRSRFDIGKSQGNITLVAAPLR